MATSILARIPTAKQAALLTACSCAASRDLFSANRQWPSSFSTEYDSVAGCSCTLFRRQAETSKRSHDELLMDRTSRLSPRSPRFRSFLFSCSFQLLEFKLQLSVLEFKLQLSVSV